MVLITIYYQGNLWGYFFTLVTTYPLISIHLQDAAIASKSWIPASADSSRSQAAPGRRPLGISALAHRMGGGQWRTAGPGLGVEPKKSALRSEPKNGMEWNGMGWDGMVCVDTFVFTLFSWNKNTTIWKFGSDDVFDEMHGIMNDLPHTQKWIRYVM